MQASALDGAFCLCLDALVRSHLCRCARLKKQSPKPFCSLLFNYRNLCRVCRCCRCCFLQSFFFFSVLSGLGFHSRCIWPRLCVWVQRDIYEAAPCWKAFCVDIRGAVRRKEKGLHQSRSERGEAIVVFLYRCIAHWLTDTLFLSDKSGAMIVCFITLCLRLFKLSW